MGRVDPTPAQDGRRPARPRLAAELVPVALILATLAGTLALVLTIHRRTLPPRKAPTPPVVAVVEVPPEVTAPAPQQPAPDPGPPPEDPTPAELARLAALRDEQRGEADRANGEAEALERARSRTMAEATRIGRREQALRDRARALDGNLTRLETELENLAFQRDALAREREGAKATLDREKARARDGYSVQPYKGPNGTWRRPIAIECTNGMVKIQPDGPTFGLLDLSPLRGMRSNPFLAAVARETVRLQGGPTPDGAPSVPYILFVIRPDGIRPYYEALMRLEPLGLAFGYELVDQDWVIDYPSPDEFMGKDTTPALPRWPADRPLAGGRGGTDAEGATAVGRPASGPGGKPLLFSGESPGPISFEPVPSLDVGDGPLPDLDGGEGPLAGRTGPEGGNGPPGLGSGVGEGVGQGAGDGPLGSGKAGSPLAGRAGPQGGAGSPGLGRGDGAGGLPGSGLGPVSSGRVGVRGTNRPGGVAAGSGGTWVRGGSQAAGERAGGTGGTGGSPTSGRGQTGTLADKGPVAPLDPQGDPASATGGDGDAAVAKGSDLAMIPFAPAAPRGQSRGGSASAPSTSGGGGEGGQGGTDLAQIKPTGPPSLYNPADYPDATDQPTATGGSGGGTGSASGDPSPSGGRSPAGPNSRGASPRSGSNAGGFAANGLDSARANGSSGSGGAISLRGNASPSGPNSSPGVSMMQDFANAPPDRLPVGLAQVGGTGSKGSGKGSGSTSGPSSGSGSGSGSARKTTGTDKGDGDPANGPRPQRTLDLVVSCGPRGVVIHPGAYRLSATNLKAKDANLVKSLRTIAAARQLAEPEAIWNPRVRFQVEPGGQKTYWTARGQVLMEGLDWPTTVRLADAIPRTFGQELR